MQNPAVGRAGTTPLLSAGILLFRRRAAALEVLLAHPGGPFWARRDEGVWTVPKGLVEPGEDLLAAARRELREETGLDASGSPDAAFLDLGSVRQRSGKVVHVWALEHDCDPAALRSNECEIEWPPRSGRRVLVPEVDRFEFFELAAAARKILPAQVPFLERLGAALESRS